jgi:hypothetical protein
MPAPRLLAAFVLVALARESLAADTPWQSHAPTRPLPTASNRPLDAAGPTYFVAPAGDDGAAGSQEKPWRTIAHGVGKLKAGDTLVVRGGTYHEHVTATLVGTAEKLITIRSYPGELTIIDGGLPEFLKEPATAWEPDPDGVAGEFRSTKVYPGVGQSAGDLQVGLLGNFADSMTPLHGYWSHGDLQSDNPYFNLNEEGTKGGKVKAEKNVYCGPGVWYDQATGRIHCRLAHTKLSGLGDDNYRGETDPRKTPLIIAPWGAGSVVRLTDSRHVRLQDLVLRGARQQTLWIDGGREILLEGITAYGGHAPMKVDGVQGFRMAHSACRGLAAPWTWRGSLKYRSIESRLFTTGGWDSGGVDGRMYEIAYSEFTDSVDGIFVGNIDTVFFHHNFVDNVSDDGVFVTAATGYDGKTVGGGHFYYQNRFARILSTFAFGVGHGRQKTIADATGKGRWGDRQLGGGLKIYRNVFDYRRPVMYHWPTGPDDAQDITFRGRFAGDHGSPAWEEMEVYNNTFLAGDPPRYEYGTDGFSRAVGGGTSRYVFNNIVCQLNGLPGTYFPTGDSSYYADANLLWSVTDGPTTAALPQPRYPRDYVPPREEWGKRDRWADPKFLAFDADWRKPVDLRLQKESPAVNAGLAWPESSTVAVPHFDELLPQDAGKVDIGAIPLGMEPWRVGVGGRIDVNGNSVSTATPVPPFAWREPESWANLREYGTGPRIAVVTGYPAFEAPLTAYALRKAGAKVDEFERTFLDPREFSKYKIVVVDGSMVRAKMTKTAFADEELPIVKKYLEDGGTLWLFRERFDLFAGDAGKKLVGEWLGSQPRDNGKGHSIRKADHPWLAHLKETGADTAWVESAVGGLNFAHGESLIANAGGKAILARTPVGKGQIIYVGWGPSNSLPNGRVPPKVADERRFSDQMQIITNIAQELCKP